MKIKIVVRPENEGADEAAAADAAQRARVRRNRFGLMALAALVAIGAVAAFLFVGSEPAPVDRAEQSAPPAAASAPGAPPAPADATAGDATAGDATAGDATAGDATAGDAGGAPAGTDAAATGAAGAGDLAGRPPEASPAPTASEGVIARESAGPVNPQGTPPQAQGEQQARTLSSTDGAPSTSGPVTAGGSADPTPPPATGNGRPPSAVDSAVPNPAPGRAATTSPGQTRTPTPGQTPAEDRPQDQVPVQTGETEAQAPGRTPGVATVPARPSPGVARAQLTSRVSAREPVDTLRSPVEIGPRGRNVFYFTEFRNLSGQTISHRWEHNGQVVASIPFKIGGERWRVYSSKQIGAAQDGDWRVSAVDRNGTVLSSVTFDAN